jgi:hypothetical protein
MGRTLGENPIGPLPGSVDISGVWNRAATEHQSSNTARNPQPHSKLEKEVYTYRNKYMLSPKWFIIPVPLYTVYVQLMVQLDVLRLRVLT